MKTPRAGSEAKAWTEFSTPERTRKVPSSEREGQDRQQHGPALQCITLLHHDGGMQQRGCRQPGHEGRVLHRIPEPPATPAKLVIGPVAAERDTRGQAAPGNKGQATPARARRDRRPSIRAATAGEGHRQPDIAKIEERRMDRQRRILQQRSSGPRPRTAPDQAGQRDWR